MNVQQKTKGFTIIEVVLVLAIAGLIFLLIFLALPALQRNQRDQAKRQDIGRLISAVQSYQSNNQGKRPGSGAAITSPQTTQDLHVGGTGTAQWPGTYLENFLDPSGTRYTTSVKATGIPTAAPGSATVIDVYPNTACTSTTFGSATGKTALVITMENSGFYCQEL